MADYTSSNTGAVIDTAVDNVEAMTGSGYDGIVKVSSSTQYEGFQVHNGSNIVAELFGFGASNDDGGVKLYSGGSATTEFYANSASKVATDFTVTDGVLNSTSSHASTSALQTFATNASWAGGIQLSRATRVASASYGFFVAQSNNGVDTEFNLSGEGNGTCDGSWTGGGADYAEFFEWADGNASDEDRAGFSVVLDGDKIRPAVDGETPFGVVSRNPSVVGDGDIDRWKGKYLRDDFGAYLKEIYTQTEWVEVVEPAVDAVLDEDGEVVTPAKAAVTEKHSYQSDQIPNDVTVPDDAETITGDENGPLTRRVLNPAYDPDSVYTPRADRQEWDTIGLMGKLRLRKGQPVAASWIKMRDVSADVEEWLVK